MSFIIPKKFQAHLIGKKIQKIFQKIVRDDISIDLQLRTQDNSL